MFSLRPEYLTVQFWHQFIVRSLIWSFLVMLINFPFLFFLYVHLSSPKVIPVSLGNLVIKSNSIFMGLMLLAYNLRSSTKNLWVTMLFLLVPHWWPFKLRSKNDKGLVANINNKTNKLSSWKIPFKNYVTSVVIDSFHSNSAPLD